MCNAESRPSTTCLGTIISSRAGESGSLRWTTSKPSCPIVVTSKYLLTSLILVSFFEGRVPWVKWA